MRLVALLLLSVFVSSSDPPADQVRFVLGESAVTDRAVRTLLERRAASGDLDAEYSLLTFEMFTETPSNLAAYRTELASLAERGHAGAASLLASVYTSGRNGVPVDYDEAARWLARAAELSDERAARSLEAYRAYTATR